MSGKPCPDCSHLLRDHMRDRWCLMCVKEDVCRSQDQLDAINAVSMVTALGIVAVVGTALSYSMPGKKGARLRRSIRRAFA